MKSDLIDIEACKIHETPKAYLLDVGMDEPIWFSKSASEFDGKTLTCREAIASFIPGGHCAGRDTLVGCHLPTIGKGISTKVTDLSVACGCSRCHDILDGRDQNAQEYIANKYPTAMMERLLNGLVETHSILLQRGIITVPDGKII